MNEKPARAAAALGTLAVAGFYLIAQMVGAGLLIDALVGIGFAPSVLLTGVFMLTYVVFGGMIATTWVQIIKAVLLMAAAIVMSIFVLVKVGNPIDLFRDARSESGEGAAYLEPGLFLTSPIDTISLGLGLVLGTAGLPHILMRFFTVPDAKAARKSVVWAVGLIGVFYVLTTLLGFGSRAALQGSARGREGGRGRQPRRPVPGREPRRRRGQLRRRRLPRDRGRGGLRDDPRGGRRPGDLGVRRGGARRVLEHHQVRRGQREGRGLGRPSWPRSASACSPWASRSSPARA